MTGIGEKIAYSTRRAVQLPAKVLLNLVDAPVVVLLYHRVARLPWDHEMLAVTPENFRAQMRFLKNNFPIARFEEDWSGIRTPSVAVTFDDGYADNFLEALPILEEVGVPATFFVSTGAIGTEKEYWWHELERVLLHEVSLPPRLTLHVGDEGRSWSSVTEEERLGMYLDLVTLLNEAEPQRREFLLSEIRRWAGKEAGRDAVHRSMTVEELRLLSASPLVTIGAHTVTHSRLSSLDTAAQRREIAASKRQLESWLGAEVTVFSYPFGRQSDYTGETVSLCREAGFAKAASNFPGQAHRWSDPFQVPRHLVRNWPAEEFAKKLERFWRT